MNDDFNMQERLSALADGQLEGDEFAQAMQFAETEDGMATWQVYHLVGDVMRSSELARPVDLTFLSNLREKLEAETHSIAPVVASPVSLAVPGAATASSANAAVFHWKLAAGVASLAAVAAIGWQSYVGISGASGAGAQLASAPAAVSQQAQGLALAENATQPVMIRDPRLDELLAAHRQFGSTSSLQMPAGFLRNATFEAPAR